MDRAARPTWVSQTAGTYTVQARTTDKAGNALTGSAVTFTLVASTTGASLGTATDTTGASTLQISGVTAVVGKSLFVAVAMEATGSNVTVSDSAGNSWTKDADVTNTGFVRTLLFSARVTTALSAATVTISFPSPTPGDKAASLFSFDGLVAVSPQDKSHTATGNGNTPSSGATTTTSQADELLIGAIGEADGRALFDPGVNFSPLTTVNANGAGGQVIFPEYRLVNAMGTYDASATNNNNKPGQWAAAIVTYKLGFPSVSSIARASASPTNASGVNFTVTFNQSVFGVDASDFALATSGVTGASITGVSGSGTTRTVTVNTGSGSGSIGLNLVDDDSITNLNAVPLGGTGATNGNFTGEVYSIDRTPPSVSSISRADSNPTNASSVHWTVTFSKSVTGVDATDFAVGNGGLSGPSITGVSGSGTTFTVTAGTGTGDGTLGLNLVDDDSITDSIGNKLGGAGTGNGNSTGESYTIDRTES